MLESKLEEAKRQEYESKPFTITSYKICYTFIIEFNTSTNDEQKVVCVCACECKCVCVRASKAIYTSCTSTRIVLQVRSHLVQLQLHEYRVVTSRTSSHPPITGRTPPSSSLR